MDKGVILRARNRSSDSMATALTRRIETEGCVQYWAAPVERV